MSKQHLRFGSKKWAAYEINALMRGYFYASAKGRATREMLARQFIATITGDAKEAAEFTLKQWIEGE